MADSLATNSLPKKVVILGAGVSGATVARKLKEQFGIEPTIIESKDYVGGKLKTYTSPEDPRVKTEYGAGVLTTNYDDIIDVIISKGIGLEKLLPTDLHTVEFSDNLLKMHPRQQFAYITEFLWQNIKFASKVWAHNRACERLDEKPPFDQEKSFKEYAEKHKLETITTFLDFLGPKFGYGQLDDPNNTAGRMFDYMGYTTIPSVSADTLVCVHNGYQQVVEKMLEDFDVKTSAKIQSIERKDGKATIHYTQNGENKTEEADMLVLAMSPYYWKDLGMQLTPAEEDCVKQLSYYRYPVAICKIKGLPPEQEFIMDPVEKENYGHPAFLFTRDNRYDPEGGRLYSVYINLPEGQNNYQFDEKTKADIVAYIKEKFPKVTDVSVDDGIIWPDYNPSVPWKTGIALQKDETKNGLNTLHVGTYLPGSFETVAGASQYARKALDRWFHIHRSKLKENLHKLHQAYRFFKEPRHQAVDDFYPEPKKAASNSR